jgi:hypothetical protein
MNTPKAIEIAVAQMLRTHAELVPGISLRPWQSLDNESGFVRGNDREFPCIDIRFAPDTYNEDQATLVCIGEITAMTLTEEDRTHQQASAIYEAVHGLALSIFAGSHGRTATTLYTEFKALVLTLTDNAVSVGGITMEQGAAPSSDEKTNQIGIGLGVHFAYADA